MQIENYETLLANETLEHMVISVQDSVWQSSAYLLDKTPKSGNQGRYHDLHHMEWGKLKELALKQE